MEDMGGTCPFLFLDVLTASRQEHTEIPACLGLSHALALQADEWSFLVKGLNSKRPAELTHGHVWSLPRVRPPLEGWLLSQM